MPKRKWKRTHHHDATRYHVEEVTKLTQQLDQIRRWKDRCYEDRLEGRLAEDFWLQKWNELTMEQARIDSNILAHQAADAKYYEQGCVILELAQRADSMWDSLSAPRNRRLLQTLLSNSSLRGGRIEATYRQPFDLLAELAEAQAQKNRAPISRNPVSTCGGVDGTRSAIFEHLPKWKNSNHYMHLEPSLRPLTYPIRDVDLTLGFRTLSVRLTFELSPICPQIPAVASMISRSSYRRPGARW